MTKKSFKVMLHTSEGEILKEVKGYFTLIKNVRVFIYKDLTITGRWYVIDLDTGVSVTSGYTMAEAKIKAINCEVSINELKETEEYKKYRFKYQALLKQYKERSNNEYS